MHVAAVAIACAELHCAQQQGQLALYEYKAATARTYYIDHSHPSSVALCCGL
jgi:hypothetical protein